jgi:hypothetical protein
MAKELDNPYRYANAIVANMDRNEWPDFAKARIGSNMCMRS